MIFYFFYFRFFVNIKAIFQRFGAQTLANLFVQWLAIVAASPVYSITIGLSYQGPVTTLYGLILSKWSLLRIPLVLYCQIFKGYGISKSEVVCGYWKAMNNLFVAFDLIRNELFLAPMMGLFFINILYKFSGVNYLLN